MHPLPAAPDADAGGVRRRKRRRRPDVHRRGARGQRGSARAAVRGPAGKLLDKLLAEIGLERGDVCICNMLKCRPPGNRDPQPNEIESCQGYLRSQVELIEPKLICTLGNFATKLLRDDTTGISRLHGQVQEQTIGDQGGAAIPALSPGRRPLHPVDARRSAGRLPSASRTAGAPPLEQPEALGPIPEPEDAGSQPSPSGSRSRSPAARRRHRDPSRPIRLGPVLDLG